MLKIDMKKSSKVKLFLMVISMLLLVSLTGCGSTTHTVKAEDMEIVLSKEYKASTLANTTWYYESPDGIALGIRSRKEDVEKSGLEVETVKDYAEEYIKANSIPKSPEVKSRDGKSYVYFEYSKTISGTEYSYLTCVYDNVDEYWLVSFACYKELYSTYKADFFDAADSVKFVEEQK